MTDKSETGRWITPQGEKVYVIVRDDGGIRMEGDRWWTCCTAETWKKWKSRGYVRAERVSND